MIKSFLLPILQSLSNNRGRLLALVLIVLFVCGLVIYTDEGPWWNTFLDPVIGLGTFLFAIAVWYGELLQDWEHKLPKRLTVRFVYQDQLVMICKDAVLVSEADIRRWGQQIGRQMNKNHNLDFDAFFEIKEGDPAVGRGQYYKPYYLVYYLTELPNRIEGMQTCFSKNQYLRWEQLRAGRKDEAWCSHPAALPPLDQNADL